MNGAQEIVNTLKQQGVNQIFGYPGGAIMPLYDALFDGGINHLLCRHEQGAAMAAIGYARAGLNRGIRAGVCIATSGPGATNLITGLAEAMLDSIPLIAITGQVTQDAIGTDAFQEVDVLGLSMAVTKHSFLVRDVNQLGATIERAFEIACTGRPGPVLIDIPKDVQLATVNKPQSYLAPAAPSATLNENALCHAQRLIAQAKQPVAYIGGGVAMANATDALRAFLHDTQMPSVATLKGLGAIDPKYNYYMGMLGMHGSKAANLAVQACDLLVVIGARFDDRVTGKLDSFAPHAKVIHLDVDASEFDKRRAVDVAISAPLNEVLPQLAQALHIAPWQQQIRQNMRHFAPRYDYPNTDIYAPSLLRQLSQNLPDDSVVCCDVGQHQMWVAQHMQFSACENHLSSAGLGTMGFGLPAAIGAQLARPQNCVVLVSGDGSIMMNIQELTTIKRAQLPIKIVLIDNNRLGMVRQWQSLFFEGRHSQTILDDNPDFVTLASAFDIQGESITQQAQIDGAFARMLAHPSAYFLHVCIDTEQNVWPLVPPNSANQHMLEQA